MTFEDDLDPIVAAWFNAPAHPLPHVVAHRASPPEYPGLALVPVADLDRLALYVELPKNPRRPGRAVRGPDDF